MSKLDILEFPDPRLRTVAKPVDTYDEGLQELVKNMLETMYEAEGIGLAATQVNVHQQLLVMDISDARDQPKIYINPRIITADGTQVYEEGCLSVPGIYANVTRAEQISIQAETVEGETIEEELDGLHAICLQHEMDHLQGKLFVDYLSPLKRQMVRKKLEKQRKQAAQDAHTGAAI